MARQPHRPPDVKRPGSAAAQPGRQNDSPGGRIESKNTEQPGGWQVVIIGNGRCRPWSPHIHATKADAECVCASLRAVRMHAEARPVDAEPEHRGDRRRFLIAMLMLGAIPSERLTERILAEVDREATTQ